MSKKKYSNVKNRSSNGRFLAFPHVLLNHPDFISLKPHSVKLLIDIFMQFNGSNNGDFTIARKLMKLRGWKSHRMIDEARDELLEKNFILNSRIGGRRKCSLYAVTWLSVDHCNGKLDIQETKTASRSFKAKIG